MKKSWITGLLAVLLSLAILCGCGQQPIENTQATTTAPTTGATTVPTTEATTMPEETTEPEPEWIAPDFELASAYAFVYDSATDSMIFTKGDQQALVAPASLTKLYSSYVALQFLDPETVITVGSEVNLIDPDSSVAYIYSGQKITVEMCVEGMLLQSGNDAAYILGVAAGRAISGNPTLSETAALGLFAGKMNEIAIENGLENTHFSNPDGIDAPGHYTTLEDLAKISRLVLKNPLIRKYAAMATDEVTYVSGEVRSWKNTNELLQPDSQFYCPDAFGLKTGSTTNAGKCLISAFYYENGYLLIGVLGCPEDLQRYVDTLNLYHHFTGQPLEEYDLEITE